MGFSRLRYKLTRLPRCIYHSATEKCFCKTLGLFLNLLSCPLSLRPSEEEGEIHFSPWDACHLMGKIEARRWSGLQLPTADSWTMVKLQAPPARSYRIWEDQRDIHTFTEQHLETLNSTDLWVSACTSVPHEPLCLTASRRGSDGLFHQEMWIEVVRRMHQFGKSSDQMKKIYTEVWVVFLVVVFFFGKFNICHSLFTPAVLNQNES